MFRMILMVSLAVPCCSVAAQGVPLQQTPGYCIPPDPPLMDDASLKVLEMTKGAEISRYVDEAQAYSLCLDETKKQLYAEINGYLELYRDTDQK